MKKYIYMSIPVICLICVMVILKTVLFIGYVPSASMAPTIRTGSIIIANRYYRELDKGDIIVFNHDNTVMVKRIAAIPGETITIGNKKYLAPLDGYFVLGDNTNSSFDSRYWNEPFVKKADIIAVLVCKLN